MTDLVLETKSAVLDSTGAAEVEFAPAVYGRQWQVERMSTSGASAKEPTCQVYRGANTPGALIDTTVRGNGDISETDLFVGNGDRIIVKWSKGTSGAVMSYRIEGLITGRVA